MQHVVDWFCSWPRWLKGGLLSAFAAFVLYAIAIFFPSLRFIFFAGLLPAGEYFSILVPINVFPELGFLDLDLIKIGAGDMIFGIVSSFFFGVVLEKICQDLWVAIFLWSATFIVGWFINYFGWMLFIAFMGAVIS